MYYKLSHYHVVGKAIAQYDEGIPDLLAITAVDGAWDRGKIMYLWKFRSSSNSFLEGLYTYWRWPHRMNKVTGILLRGEIGTHEVSVSSAQAMSPRIDNDTAVVNEEGYYIHPKLRQPFVFE